jgi:hypothetical protein
MTVIEWTDRTALNLDKLVQVERLDDPEKWQDWANNILKTPNLEGQNTPNPYQFDDWMEWAMRFNQNVDLLG